MMLNPRVSFYLYQNGSIFLPVNNSHHVIDAVFIPAGNTWRLLYTEKRNGHSFIWEQKLNQAFNTIDRLLNNATQVRLCLFVFRVYSIQLFLDLVFTTFLFYIIGS